MQSKDEILADDWPVSRCERTERLIHSTSRPLQPTRQDLMIRFPRHCGREGDHHGWEEDFGKEVTGETERRGASAA
jgi:hypothetical protein